MMPVQIATQLESLWCKSPTPYGFNGRLHIGIDVVDIETIGRQLRGSAGDRFCKTVFSESEIEDCRGRPDRFATRWALKEAVAKAIGSGFRLGLRPKAIEVVTNYTGAISVRPSLDVVWPHEAAKWQWTASASHEGGIAAAIVVAVEPIESTEKGSTHD
ncbi:hypothetical protein CH249_09970 [Rhodococcus sp. 05-2255-3B1]|uniref:holo-ACP synthase n=1 Tax=unclassified Rhodococcus (in: high G+C Gram-positive bacteria) TaxID=192944 RepID=UPI000B9B312A|nr:hypothetical protein CH250_20285 [Rhodococcus sp. 05-2255-3C]OZE11784.1 hypothetical protein CH249_09970 [Rhodococcus sp. 05-2255-3B1]OZE24191.1 hypothetical protein CH255_02475 [Rhodococcus sp. 05-2255-2A2]